MTTPRKRRENKAVTDSPAKNTRSHKKLQHSSNKLMGPDESVPWYNRKWIRTIDFEDCPAYLQDNEFVRKGYRCGYTYRQSYLSLFHIHNETVNVWTHLLGFFLCLILMAYTWYSPELGSLSVEDKIVLCMFLALHSYTLFFSSLLHLHICVSADAQTFWSCLDHSGISASIGGGSIALMYLLLHCHGSMRIVWMGLLMLCNCVGIVGPLFPSWRGPEFRVYRSLIYVCSGGATFCPIIYYIVHEGTSKLPLDLNENFALGYVFLMAFQYCLGAFIYASRIPERFWPGKFDYIFQSHNIWHVLVVTGSVTLWKATIGLIQWKYSDLEMCSGV